MLYHLICRCLPATAYMEGVGQTKGVGSMAGNGGRGRGKGFVRLTRAGRRSSPHSNTRRPSWRNTPFPGLLCNRSP